MKIQLKGKTIFFVLLFLLIIEIGIFVWQSIDAGRVVFDLSLILAMVACVCCIPSCFESEK